MLSQKAALAGLISVIERVCVCMLGAQRKKRKKRGRWKKERVLTGRNAQWGSRSAYQLTSNQTEGKNEGRRGSPPEE